MRTTESAIELHAMPAGRKVVDATDDVWEKTPQGMWYYDPLEPELGTPVLLSAEDLLHVWGPVRIMEPQYGHIAYMGEDGQLHDLGATIVDSDFSWTGTPNHEDTTRVATNYTAELKFDRVEYGPALRRLMAGTPKEELLARVNARLVPGNTLGRPVNWKGL